MLKIFGHRYVYRVSHRKRWMGIRVLREQWNNVCSTFTINIYRVFEMGHREHFSINFYNQCVIGKLSMILQLFQAVNLLILGLILFFCYNHFFKYSLKTLNDFFGPDGLNQIFYCKTPSCGFQNFINFKKVLLFL